MFAFKKNPQLVTLFKNRFHVAYWTSRLIRYSSYLDGR